MEMSQHVFTSAPAKTQSELFMLAAKTLGYDVQTVGMLEKSSSGEKRQRPVYKISNGNKELLNAGAITEQTSYLGMKLAVSKIFTSRYLRSHNLPVPEQLEIQAAEDVSALLEKHTSIVIKPAASRAGKGIFGGVTDVSGAKTAINTIRSQFPNGTIIAEEQVFGSEFRIVIINGKFIAAAMYHPPTLVGDGKSSIKSLIEKENASPLRNNGWLYPIKTGESLDMQLANLGLSYESILENNQPVTLHVSAPISGGGTVSDVSHEVSEENKAVFEKIAATMRLNIAGIDVIAPSLSDSLMHSGGRVIEVNGGPDFRIHYNVHHGTQRNLAETVLKDFFEN